jgi:hypothetical protein
VKFEWDEAKRQTNVRKHGLDMTIERIGAFASPRQTVLSSLSCTLRLMTKPSVSSRSGGRARRNGENTSKHSQTDWARVDATRDEDIDYSDSPEATPEMLLNAIIVYGPNEARFTVTTDEHTARWFMAAPEGRDAAVRDALREHMERHPRER